jgi:fumarate reductase flavoprotein subunit
MAIIRNDSPRFEQHVHVAVIGGGACGLTAATAARGQGVDVLVFERDARLAGSTAMSIGAVCGVGTAAQREHGVDDSPESFVADVMSKTANRADAGLTAAIARESGPTLDWLRHSHDVPLELDLAWRGLGHSVPRLHVPPARNGEELVALLARATDRTGADVLLEARVTDLYADGHDRVTGVRLQRRDGSHETIGCDAVVLATCGFGANQAWIERYIPEMRNARYFGHEGNEGDGIAWGMELGAEVADMSGYQGLGTLADPQSVIVPHTLLIDGGVLVNSRGVRFVHELDNISGLCIPVLAQPDGAAWVIFDAARLAQSREHSGELRQLVETGAVKQAATIGELAGACRIDPAGLERTVAPLGALCVSGEADGFGRRFQGLQPLSPPWCALKVTGALFHTQGGLRVNERAQVLRGDGRTLPNVFAGGGAARGISGPHVTGYLPAMGLCMAITLGRLAGNAAARLAASRGA